MAYPSIIILYENKLYYMCSKSGSINGKDPMGVDIGAVGADGKPISLLRYTKDKIDPNIVTMSIWEKIEIFLGGKYNVFLSHVKLLFVAGSIVGFIVSLEHTNNL